MRGSSKKSARRKSKEGLGVNLNRSIPKSINKPKDISISMSTAKSDLDSLEATIETLENEHVMGQLERSEQDIQKGKVRNIREFLKEI